MRKILLFICLILIHTAISGCFMMPVDMPLPPPLTIPVPSVQEFTTEPVRRGDIKSKVIATGAYAPYGRVYHYFSVDDVPVLGIYVAIGQEVSEGDIIAELDVLELEAEYEELIRKRGISRLELSQLEEKQRIITRQAANAGIKLDNSSYLWSRDTLRLAIAHIDKLLENIEEEKVERNLYAAADGIITTVMIFHEGMLSNSKSSVATVSTEVATLFSVAGDAVVYLKPGDRVEMILDDELYAMEVIDPDDYGNDIPNKSTNAFLAFIGTQPEPGFGSSGEVHIALGEAKDVLYIPADFLWRSEERTFVYILNSSGVREIRYVVTGLEGSQYVEIVSGLSEGELVILWVARVY